MKLKEQIANTNWSSRKLIIMVSIGVLSTVLLLTGDIDPDNWVKMMTADFFVYGASNALSKPRRPRIRH